MKKSTFIDNALLSFELTYIAYVSFEIFKETTLLDLLCLWLAFYALCLNLKNRFE